MIYYTSDLHLSNKNIIKHENRPFNSVEEMDSAFIYGWNQVVSNKDKVYVLGDFCFKGATKAIQYILNLNGEIHFLRGNHDYWMSQKCSKDFFDSYTGFYNDGHYEYIKDGENRIVLCHYPILHWENMEQGSIHLYGHCHSYRDCSAMAPNSYNIGVDVNNYRPVTLAQLLKRRVK